MFGPMKNKLVEVQRVPCRYTESLVTEPSGFSFLKTQKLTKKSSEDFKKKKKKGRKKNSVSLNRHPLTEG